MFIRYLDTVGHSWMYTKEKWRQCLTLRARQLGSQSSIEFNFLTCKVRQQCLFYPFQPQMMITSMTKKTTTMKTCKILGIQETLPFVIPPYQMGHPLTVSCCKMRTLLGGTRHHHIVVGRRPINTNARVDYSCRQNSNSAAGLSSPPLQEKRMLFAGTLATGHSGTKAHPSVFLIIPWADKCGISKQPADGNHDRERGAESGRALCPLRLPVIISEQAEKPRQSVREEDHRTPLCSQDLPVSCPWLFLSQPFSVNIFENNLRQWLLLLLLLIF